MPKEPMFPQEFALSTNATAVPSVTAENINAALESYLSSNVREHPVTLKIPEEYLTWIGLITTHWAFAEWILAGTLGTILGIDRKQGRVIIGTRIGAQAITKIKQLMEIKGIAIPDYFPDLTKSLKECEEARNLVGHGVWMRDAETKELCIQNPSGEWKVENQKSSVSRRKYPEAQYLDINWFRETLENIRDVIRRVQNFDLDIAVALDSLRDKS